MADRVYPRLHRVDCVASAAHLRASFALDERPYPRFSSWYVDLRRARHCGSTPAELVMTMALLSELLKIAAPILRPCESAKAVPKRGAGLVLEEV
jgi:hypothetical protein